MDDGSIFDPKSSNDQSVEEQIDRPLSDFTKRAANESNDNETNSMRVILPVFIENEQKYAQHDRKRKIQSSPAKSMQRFNQDSLERHVS